MLRHSIFLSISYSNLSFFFSFASHLCIYIINRKWLFARSLVRLYELRASENTIRGGLSKLGAGNRELDSSIRRKFAGVALHES